MKFDTGILRQKIREILLGNPVVVDELVAVFVQFMACGSFYCFSGYL